MSQRNPLNDRYQQREGGKTRKSAASAKPATKAASSVYIADPNAKPKKSFFDRFKGKQEPEKESSKSSAQAAEATEQPKKKGGKWTLNDMEGSEVPQSWYERIQEMAHALVDRHHLRYLLAHSAGHVA